MNAQIEQLLREMIEGFTRFHDDLTITSTATARSLFLSVTPAADDVGKVIGSQGAMVKALRCVVRRLGEAADVRVKLSVNEPVSGERLTQEPFRSDPDYNPLPAVLLLGKVGRALFNDGVSVKVSEINSETTMLTLDVDGTPPDRGDELEEALGTIMCAVGKSHGRMLYVELAAKEVKV